MNLLAEISGNQLIHSVLLIVVIGVIFGLFWWLIDYCGLPAPFAKIAKIVMAIAGVLILCDILLSFTGNGFIRWR